MKLIRFRRSLQLSQGPFQGHIITNSCWVEEPLWPVEAACLQIRQRLTKIELLWLQTGMGFSLMYLLLNYLCSCKQLFTHTPASISRKHSCLLTRFGWDPFFVCHWKLALNDYVLVCVSSAGMLRNASQLSQLLGVEEETLLPMIRSFSFCAF